MDTATRQLHDLLELEARHDDLLRRLDDLDKRVAKVVAQCVLSRTGQEGAADAVGGSG